MSGFSTLPVVKHSGYGNMDYLVEVEHVLSKGMDQELTSVGWCIDVFLTGQCVVRCGGER